MEIKEIKDEIRSEADAIAAITAAALVARKIDENTYLALPSDFAIKNLEHLMRMPSRPRGDTVLHDAASFIAIASNMGPSTRIYATLTPPKFVAVGNDNSGDIPGWRDWTATYACPLSAEWKTWTAASGRQMTQEEFARFIEDNIPDVATPPAADMLEIARSLEAKKKVNFAAGIRLSNGQSELTYEETIQGTAAKGKLSVPEVFTIGVPVFENGFRYAVDARLRYRISDGGKLAMWFELVRPHKILEDAFKAVWDEIATGTGLSIVRGVANQTARL